ncbi:MAG TPA: hypothetical protein VG225_00570, partial [Terracidiphilus sp.]|nr:hypothetical protein [Terracidiphilus sp.]
GCPFLIGPTFIFYDLKEPLVMETDAFSMTYKIEPSRKSREINDLANTAANLNHNQIARKPPLNLFTFTRML